MVFDPRVPHTFVVGNGAGKAPKEPIFAVTAFFLKGEMVDDTQAKLAKLGFRCTGAEKLANLPEGLAEPKMRIKLSCKLFKEQYPPAAPKRKYCPNCSCESCAEIRASKAEQ